MHNAAPTDQAAPGDDTLVKAVQALLAPLAQLAVSQGLSYAAMDELFKQALVQAAHRSLVEDGVTGTRLVSRISTRTGIHRKEVSRLSSASAQAPDARSGKTASLASQVFAQWMADPRWHDEHGQPLALKRQGDALSFEALARVVTQDVHPRSVLDELCRLGMASLDEASDTVALLKHAFVPGGDRQHMLAFMGDNVGDHFQGAVDNVHGGGPRPHFDQAVFCAGLSDASLDVVRQFVSAQWKTLLAQAVPLLEERIALDKQAGGQAADKRVRIGLYTYGTAAEEAPAPPTIPTTSTTPRGDTTS